jgi:hypothetical protein
MHYGLNLLLLNVSCFHPWQWWQQVVGASFMTAAVSSGEPQCSSYPAPAANCVVVGLL